MVNPYQEKLHNVVLSVFGLYYSVLGLCSNKTESWKSIFKRLIVLRNGLEYIEKDS